MKDFLLSRLHRSRQPTFLNVAGGMLRSKCGVARRPHAAKSLSGLWRLDHESGEMNHQIQDAEMEPQRPRGKIHSHDLQIHTAKFMPNGMGWALNSKRARLRNARTER